MEVRVLSSKLVKPAHDACAAAAVREYVPLSVFDGVTFRTPETAIYAFEAPAPSTAAIEKGLAVTLTRYHLLAGRLGKAPDGAPAVILNDRGTRLLEASAPDADLADVAGEPTPELRKLHQDMEAREVMLLQLTRFRSGSALYLEGPWGDADGMSI